MKHTNTQNQNELYLPPVRLSAAMTPFPPPRNKQWKFVTGFCFREFKAKHTKNGEEEQLANETQMIW